jgi:hypothetical protein
MKHQRTLTLKTLTKSNVWDIQENDVFRMWEAAEKDADLKDNMHHYLDVIHSAFELEEIKIDKPVVISKYEERGYKIGTLRTDDNDKKKWAIKKRPITRVTDLTYENISHISAAKLIEVLDRNFGGGWDSLSQSIQDIIESAFDISTTTLPKDRLHKAGGMYDKKVKDGYEVLEIAKGNWVEAIFAKAKPELAKPTTKIEEDGDFHLPDEEGLMNGEGLPDGDGTEEEDDTDDFDVSSLTEESYRTTFETDPEDLNLEAEEISDEDNNY